MPGDEATESKKLELSSAIIIAALTGFLTLAGVMSTSIIGWISSAQSAAISREQTCITRIDAQEQNLRNKADAYLSSLGMFLTLSGQAQYEKPVFNSRLDDLMKTSYSFSAYAPEQLALLTVNLATQLKATVSEKDTALAAQHAAEYRKLRSDWFYEFQIFLKKFESDRRNCGAVEKPSQTQIS